MAGIIRNHTEYMLEAFPCSVCTKNPLEAASGAPVQCHSVAHWTIYLDNH